MKQTFVTTMGERWENESGLVVVVISKDEARAERNNRQYYSVWVKSNGKGKTVASRTTYETAMEIVKSYEQ